jgi:hypothetical protein
MPVGRASRAGRIRSRRRVYQAIHLLGNSGIAKRHPHRGGASILRRLDDRGAEIAAGRVKIGPGITREILV